MPKSKSRKRKPPKRVLALPDLEQAKTAVLNSLTSLIGLFVLVSAGFIAFLIAAFYERTAATLISGGIDGILGWQFKQVYRHIYPAKD